MTVSLFTLVHLGRVHSVKWAYQQKAPGERADRTEQNRTEQNRKEQNRAEAQSVCFPSPLKVEVAPHSEH